MLKYLKYTFFLNLLALFLYSFTQVDLNLTLSQASIWQVAEKGFQYIGYFNRPLSTNLFLIIVSLLFFHYLSFLYLAFKKKIKLKDVRVLVIMSMTTLVFSYNGFSYDVFNYIFDAKILTHYGENPYLHKALDFPQDPMLNFMHWTHRTYPYGPLWLGLSSVLSFLGFNFFLPTFFLFKICAASFYFGTFYFIQKILSRTYPKSSLPGLVFFALNPLVLVETLVSAHNDIVMIFFAVLSVYLTLKKRWIFAFISIILSYLVKEVTIVLLVPFILYYLSNTFSQLRMRISEINFLRLCVLFSLLGFFYVLTKMEVQPWYFLWVLPFISFLIPNPFTYVLNAGISLGLLLRYAPYLHKGDWTGYAITYKSYLTFLTPLVFVVIFFLMFFISKLRHAQK